MVKLLAVEIMSRSVGSVFLHFYGNLEQRIHVKDALVFFGEYLSEIIWMGSLFSGYSNRCTCITS